MSSLQQVHALLGSAPAPSIPGLPGVPVVSPKSILEAQELLCVVTRDRIKVAFVGCASKLGWAAMLQKPALAICTRELSGIVEFEPGDGVLTALAGTPLSELEALVRLHGLHITPAVPRAEKATLGGVIAAGQSGSDRLMHGAMRLHVLGTRLLQLNGTNTRSGGRLVKNVSGYDIHRLLAGSFGSLGLIVEASLRLMTCPEDRRVFHLESNSPEPLVELAEQLLAVGIQPEALLIGNPREQGTWEMHLSLVGRRGHVEAQAARVAKLIPSASPLDGEEANRRMEALRESEPDGNQSDVVRIAIKPSNLSKALPIALASMADQSSPRWLLHPGLATIQVQRTTPFTSLLLHQLRNALRPLAGQVSLQRATSLPLEFLPTTTDPVRARIAANLRQTYDPLNLLCTRPPLEPVR